MLYRSTYDSDSLRGKDDLMTPRPWDIVNLLSKLSSDSMRLLDLGTGTGFKIAPLHSKYKEIVGIEISKSMVAAAKRNLFKENMFLIQGNNYSLPFQRNTFDAVACMLSLWDPKEIHRVLKKDGFVLIELLGCEDKKDFKLFFGADGNGLRGQYLNFKSEEYVSNIYERFQKFFRSVSIQNGFWNTCYSQKGILKLLANTPTIRGYNYQHDKINIKNAIQGLSTPSGIKIKQNRMLLYATDPK
ncbi:MAG: methyltransferase domain-containing protein [Gammaproteobacteria bacterium]